MNNPVPPAPRTVDVDSLKKLAEKATPGPWRALHNDGVAGVTLLVHPNTQHDIANLEWENANDNASFIAACNPSTILALLDALETAETALASIQGASPDEIAWSETQQKRAETAEQRAKFDADGYADQLKRAEALQAALASVEKERDALREQLKSGVTVTYNSSWLNELAVAEKRAEEAEARFNYLRDRFQGWATALRIKTDSEPLNEAEVAEIVNTILVEEAELHG